MKASPVFTTNNLNNLKLYTEIDSAKSCTLFPTTRFAFLFNKHNIFFLDDTNKGEWCQKEYVAAGIVGGIAAVVATPFVLTAAGFTTAGVAVGSVAAGVQSAVYGGAVASSSIFAGLKSAGAAGMGAKATLTVFSLGAAATTYFKDKVAPCAEESKCSSDVPHE